MPIKILPRRQNTIIINQFVSLPNLSYSKPKVTSEHTLTHVSCLRQNGNTLYNPKIQYLRWMTNPHIVYFNNFPVCFELIIVRYSAGA